MKLLKKYGPWACVAGAAEGLGAAFTTQLAQRGFSLIMIDQNQEALQKLEQDIKVEYAISTISLVCDLGERSCLEVIMQNIQKVNARFLIYNAAYGPVRPFLSNTPEQLDAYLKVNMDLEYITSLRYILYIWIASVKPSQKHEMHVFIMGRI